RKISSISSCLCQTNSPLCLHDLDEKVVELPHDPRRPVLGDEAELVVERDGTVGSGHAGDGTRACYGPAGPSASAICLASGRQTGCTVKRASFSPPKRSARCFGFAGGSAPSTETSSRGYDPRIWLRRASKLCPECTITRRSVSVRMNDATRASASNPKT